MKLSPVRLSYKELWLLDLVIDYGQRLSRLGKMDHYFFSGKNKPPIEFEREELIESLMRLVAENWIEGYLFCGFSFQEKPETPIELTRGLIDFELARDSYKRIILNRTEQPHAYFRLTPTGGVVWEEFARPFWNHFIEGPIPQEDGELGTEQLHQATCASRERLAEYLERAAFHDCYDVDQSSVTWSEVRPWQAKYWKELPVGHRAAFRATPADPSKAQMAFLMEPALWKLRNLDIAQSWHRWHRRM